MLLLKLLIALLSFGPTPVGALNVAAVTTTEELAPGDDCVCPHGYRNPWDCFVCGSELSGGPRN